MKHVIRYLLEGDGSVPVFVENGGYFQLNEELVGISIDSAKRHLPASVHKLTRQQLIDRIALVEKDLGGNPLSLESAEQLASDLLSKNGMADYE